MNPSLLDRAKKRMNALGAALYAAVLAIVVLAAGGVAGLLVHLPWGCRTSLRRRWAA